MEMDFKNKNYLITGVTSGIGNALTKNLLNSGAIVFGIGRDAAKIDDLLTGYPRQFVFLEADLSKEIDIEKNILDFIDNSGKFDGVVNCAGKEETLPITMYNQQKLKDIFNVNFNSPFEIIRILSKKKFSNNGASFILLASVMGGLGQPGKTAYCASKSALLGLVRAAALELASRSIRVNAISPGVVDTPMTQNLFNQISEGKKENIIAMHPLGIGKIEDIIPLILFLLSENSRWVTGQDMVIDGGYSIQ
ncbi:SDR family NAD(P)-dependent oxidoreductase [Mucilaginibacter sp. UR6-11]|uniref:SDR family NAD(P)-dependent oxidoreductase n=1 Tax=Mucilaginibacter sp. UR6-11 TaxID=1435644 RepID=UPI001E3A7E1B|nr:SDR family oxidoreductase [Mucilaginibacter sp. UR6-11]MCC8424868.1 SDR family oxidoreductase [Mucilaginibacter sp. UR6-11]